MKKFTQPLLFALLLVLLAVLPVYAVVIFSENFDSLTPGEAITTSNTNFDYVRIGLAGGSITAEAGPTGEMHMLFGGSPGGSLTGVGITNTLGNQTVTTMNFRLALEDTNGDIFVGMGDGTMFYQNTIFVTAQLMWAIQSNSGVLQYRTTGWNNVGQTLNPNQNYEFHIVANRSGATVNYGPNSVANATLDLFIDNVLVGNDLPITNNQNATGFRIYQINGSSYARIDSITIDNTAVPPFTPTAVTLTSFSFDQATTNTNIVLLAALITAVAASFIILKKRKGVRP